MIVGPLTLFENLLKKPTGNIDLLLMEGTMLKRNNSAFPDEVHVEAAISDILKKQHTISFLISSSQNIDRIVSAYRACKSTGKTLVIDIYSAWVLEQLQSVSSSVPNIDWNRVKVAFDKTRTSALFDPANRALFGPFVDRAIRNRIKGEQLRADPDQYLMLLKMSFGRIIKSFARQDAPVAVIYSQWQGYLEPLEGESRHIADMRAIKEGKYPGITYSYAHTSGHAPLDDLQRLVQAMKPAKLIPIHTEFPDRYEQLFGIGTVATDGVPVDV
jgi:ribonuclease J